jgi:hypothetical protein
MKKLLCLLSFLILLVSPETVFASGKSGSEDKVDFSVRVERLKLITGTMEPHDIQQQVHLQGFGIGIGHGNHAAYRLSWGNDQREWYVNRSLGYKGYGSHTFPPGIHVDSYAKMEYIRLGYMRKNVVTQGNGSLSLLYEVKYTHMNVGGTAAGLGSADREVYNAIPAVGIDYRYNLSPSTALTLDMSGMYAGQYGRIFDCDIGIIQKLSPEMALNLGYHYVNMYGLKHGDKLWATYDGIYLGIKARF